MEKEMNEARNDSNAVVVVEEETNDTSKGTRRSTRTRSVSSKSGLRPAVAGSDNVCSDSNGVKSEITVLETGDPEHALERSEEIEQTERRRMCPNRLRMKRKRKPGVTYLPRANNTDAYEASWNEIDKQRLLIALQRFGTMEIDNLLKAVPGKSEDDIKRYIKMKWRGARAELRAHLKESRKTKLENSGYLGPIDKWIEVLNNVFPNFDHYKANPLAHAVLLIWKYEKHPDPAECGGVDFKALYEYLYCMLCGYPPKHLNQPTAAYLAETLKNFAYGMKQVNWWEVRKFLDCPIRIDTAKKTDVTEKDIAAALSFSKEQCFDELLKIPGFNPFCVPKDLLKKKAPVPVQEVIPAAVSSHTPSFAPFPTFSSAPHPAPSSSCVSSHSALFSPSTSTRSTYPRSTSAPSTSAPSTSAPSTSAPSTSAPSTSAPSTSAPSTSAPSSSAPSSSAPSSSAPSSSAPSSSAPSSSALSTSAPSTSAPIRAHLPVFRTYSRVKYTAHTTTKH